MKINELCCYKKTDERGIGVFSNQSIAKGVMIVKDIFSTIKGTDKQKLMTTQQYHFLFVDRKNYQKNRDTCDLHIIFGPISIVNHSERPNCFLKWIYEDEVPTVELVSAQKIEEGVELFIRYKNSDEYPEGTLK